MQVDIDKPLQRVAKKMMEEMFKIQPGETVILTADEGTDRNIVDGFLRAAKEAGGKPMAIWVPVPRGEGQEAVPDLPVTALTNALLEADVWIEFNSRFLLYSEIWEKAMKVNTKLRYLIVYDATVDQLCQIIEKTDIRLMTRLLSGIAAMLRTAKRIKVQNQRGTDFSFELDPNHKIDMDDGNYHLPKFGTLPGYVNIVPKFGTMEGRVVFDELMNVGVLRDSRVEFVMEKGRITDFLGGVDAATMKKFVEELDDENMFKISHMMISLNPGVRELTGSTVIDERIYGGVDLGFGHTSPVDAPPLGQPAKSHFDGMIEKASIWIDEVQITAFGKVVHSVLAPIADAMLEYADR